MEVIKEKTGDKEEVEVRPDDGDPLDYEFGKAWVHRCCGCGLEHTIVVDKTDDPKWYTIRFWGHRVESILEKFGRAVLREKKEVE